MENENVENVVMTVEEAIQFLKENGYGYVIEDNLGEFLNGAFNAIAKYSINTGLKMGAALMGACIVEYAILDLIPWKKIGKALFKKKPKNEETKADTAANAETK